MRDRSFHRGWALAAALLAGSVLVSHVQAELLLYEPFNYALTASTDPAQGLDGTHGENHNTGGQLAPNGYPWFPTATTAFGGGPSPYDIANGVPIVSSPITVAGLDMSGAGDNGISYGGDRPGTTPRLRIADPPGISTGGVWYSFAFQINQIDHLRTDRVGGLLASLNNLAGHLASNPSAAGAGVFIQQALVDDGSGGTVPSPTLFNIGLGNGGTNGNNAVYADEEFALNETIFVVAHYEFVDESTTPNAATLYINPDPATFGDAPPADGLILTNSQIALAAAAPSIQSFFFRQGGANTNVAAGAVADLLRVGTSWAAVTPAAVSLLPGDANRDGRVDGEDFLIWQAAFGTQEGATWDDGDFNGDGRVDGEDFLIWQAHFGSVADNAAVTPEPASLALLALGMLLGLRRRRG